MKKNLALAMLYPSPFSHPSSFSLPLPLGLAVAFATIGRSSPRILTRKELRTPEKATHVQRTIWPTGGF
jgi:hypothetical protein